MNYLTESDLKAATNRLPSVQQMRLSSSRKSLADAFQQLIHIIESLPEGDLSEDVRSAAVKVLDATYQAIDFELDRGRRPSF